MGYEALVQQSQTYMSLIHTLLNCLNGFLYPILGVFGITCILGVAFYIMHRL